MEKLQKDETRKKITKFNLQHKQNYKSGLHDRVFCLMHKIRMGLLPLEPVDHVGHQGVGDAGVGLLSQQNGLPQLI